MSNQDSILYINTTLILKLTSCINKNIFTYMDISSAVCIKRRKHSKTFIYFLSGKFRHKLYNFFFSAIVCAYNPEHCSLTAPNGPLTAIAGYFPDAFFGLYKSAASVIP